MKNPKEAFLGAVFTVLVIDDSRFTLLTESMLLKQQGYRVFTAENAKQALKILSKQHIDVVITDINMPDMRGDELAAQIHQDFPHLPVVAATTANLDELMLNEKANFQTILKKPVTAGMVRQTLHTCLELEYA